ncbi:MAG: hypothetical protein ACI906_003501 [Candidatus Latescibacterota bacterium]
MPVVLSALFALSAIVMVPTGAIAQFQPTTASESLNVHTVGRLRLAEPVPDGALPPITDLYVAGNHAYLGSFAGVVYIIDISEPSAMRLVAEVDMPGPALDLKVDGDLLAVGVQQRGEDFGLVLIDISEPSAPTVLSRFSQPGWRGVHNLFLYQQRAYLAHSASLGLSVVDISKPSAPFVSGHWQHESDRFSNIVHDIFIRDRLAYISDIAPGTGGLVLLDLADPDHPQTLSSLSMPDGIHSAWAIDNFVYINQEFGGWEQALYSVDTSDPAQPQLAHTFRAQPPPRADILGPHNPSAADGLLYWAYYDGGVRIFDLAEPARPREIGYHTGSVAWSAQAHSDGLLYVADSSTGLLALRFDEPAHALRQVQTQPTTAIQGRHTSVQITARTAPSPRAVPASIAQVSARRLGSQQPASLLNPIGNGVFDGTLPLDPDLPSGRYRLHLELVDECGARYPFEQSFDIFPWQNLALYQHDEIAAGWRIVSNNAPERKEFAERATLALPPLFTLTFLPDFAPDPTGYSALRFAFHPGDVEAFTTNNFSVSIGRVAIPLFPARSDSFAVDLSRPTWQTVEIPLTEFGLHRDDSLVLLQNTRFFGALRGTAYLADIEIVAATPPTDTAIAVSPTITPPSFSLAQNFPNPFNSSTSIHYALSTRQHVELAVYNVAGQKLVELDRGERAPGRYVVSWNGRDAQGSPVASGLYLYQLGTKDQQQTRKLLLLR